MLNGGRRIGQGRDRFVDGLYQALRTGNWGRCVDLAGRRAGFVEILPHPDMLLVEATSKGYFFSKGRGAGRGNTINAREL